MLPVRLLDRCYQLCELRIGNALKKNVARGRGLLQQIFRRIGLGEDDALRPLMFGVKSACEQCLHMTVFGDVGVDNLKRQQHGAGQFHHHVDVDGLVLSLGVHPEDHPGIPVAEVV